VNQKPYVIWNGQARACERLRLSYKNGAPPAEKAKAKRFCVPFLVSDACQEQRRRCDQPIAQWSPYTNDLLARLIYSRRQCNFPIRVAKGITRGVGKRQLNRGVTRLLSPVSSR